MIYAGHGYVVEAIKEGVTLRPLDIALGPRTTLAIALRHRAIGNGSDVVDFAVTKIGMKYDLGAIVANPRFTVIGGLLASGRVDRYYCSELVHEAFENAGVALFVPPGAGAPHDLLSLDRLNGLEYQGHLLIGPSQIPIVEGR
jgi:uncharacterized protein YycO